MLSPLNLPRTNGIPIGKYRLLFQKRSMPMFGVPYANGRSKKPVSGVVVLRHRKAFGPGVTVEPWDVATAQRCLAYYEAKGDDAAVELVRAWLVANDPDATPTNVESEKKPEDLTVDELKSRLDERGAEYDKRWGKAKLLEALVASEKAADPAEPSDPAPATPSTETSEPAAPQSTDGLDALTLEQLRERAAAAGIDVGNKQERAIIKLLRRAATDAAPANAEGEKA